MFKRNAFGLIALVLGMISLLLSIVAPELLTPPDPPQGSGIVTKLAGFIAGKPKTDAQKRYELARERHERIDRTVRLAGLIGGVLAGILGLIGWIRHEHRRLALGALAVGATAALWQWIIIAVVIALVIVLLAAFSQS